MLKRKALSRIFVSSVAFFIVFAIYSFNLIKINKNVYAVTDNSNYEKISIYTMNQDDYISKGYIYVEKEMTNLEKVKLLLETMIENNNKNALLPSYFKPILPQNTKVLGATLENKIIKINFSEELLKSSSEQLEKIVEALTYTLTDLKNVNGVEIYIDGDLLKYVSNSNNSMPTIFTKDYGINKKYEFTNTKDIAKVVLYFLGDDNNLVPITRYLNDNREKIEIIVESLASNYIFYDNLMSVLNYNLKLENYELDNDTLTLVFNEYILNNKDMLSINEDVSDMLCYSIFDNYDINKVIFMVENNKIYEKLRKNLE